MRLEFFIAEAGEQACAQLRPLPSAAVEVNVTGSMAEAREAVENRFSALVSSNPKMAQIVVACPAMGAPSGRIVAVETVFTLTRSIEARHRRLNWITEESVPM